MAVSLFISYSRSDTEFALRLASELKAQGRNVWLDQLELQPGDRWDREVQHALEGCTGMLVILSPSSAASDNVADEFNFALGEKKTIVPVLYQPCKTPLRLVRFQYADCSADFSKGLQQLLKVLEPLVPSNPHAICGRRWVISGRVQGVGFRTFVMQKASELQLTGWARNLPDGRIDTYAVGRHEKLQLLGEALKVGPPAARVLGLQVSVEQADAPVEHTEGFLMR